MSICIINKDKTIPVVPVVVGEFEYCFVDWLLLIRDWIIYDNFFNGQTKKIT